MVHEFTLLDWQGSKKKKRSDHLLLAMTVTNNSSIKCFKCCPLSTVHCRATHKNNNNHGIHLRSLLLLTMMMETQSL